MSAIKTLIIAFGVVLAAVIGYSFYLHFGPIEKISNENRWLKDEITQLRKASEESKAGHQTAINEKIRRVNELEEALSEVQQEKTATRADLQEQIQG
jgi:threonine synthase